MLNLCANESALRIHLRTVDEEERRLTAIENRAAHYLLTDCSDSRTDMVMEALQEANEATADCIAIHIGHIGNKRCAVEKSRHYEQIGRLLAGMIAGYCAKEAQRIAEDEINNASCQHCFDEGCRKCREAA
jgi:hypothetical protein